jgi:hypothetical protein
MSWSLEAVKESGPHSSVCAFALISSEAHGAPEVGLFLVDTCQVCAPKYCSPQRKLRQASH